ncbi:biliverdin-producing heme oxygenase [Thalassospira sp. MA62]|nr:biliverdin-producing heme oxygenase [Thalassospira sp. MA62]
MNAQIGQMSRLEEIKQSTRDDHQSVDDMVMALAPFASRENYARFLRLQYIFHTEMKPVYEAEDLNRMIPGLAARSRHDAVCDDLTDLEIFHEVAAENRSRFAITATGPARLGWLYVCEGSSLGAAFLLKEAANIGLGATFGARHLAGHAHGRGKHWREFVEQVNGLRLDDKGELAMRKGAADAFAYFRDLAGQEKPDLQAPESLG